MELEGEKGDALSYTFVYVPVLPLIIPNYPDTLARGLTDLALSY